MQPERETEAPSTDLTSVLDKPRQDFTRNDLLDFIFRAGIRMVNFRFVGGDGRLKLLNLPATNRRQVDRYLSNGERVDGSSLFSYVDSGSSDLYVVPRYRTAFVNPFSPVPALDILCAFFTARGEPLPSSPVHLVDKAHQVLKERTGLSLRCLAELEYYVISKGEDRYPGTAQRGYTESGPFVVWEDLRVRAVDLLARMGYPVKYGHSEVGRITEVEREFEQHELEFNLSSPEDAADAVVVGRWVLRTLSARMGTEVTFAPKLYHGHAGSGLHVHSLLLDPGGNRLCDEAGMTEVGRRLVAGYLACAPSLSVFGNRNPLSYLRLVPNQEAPVHICWGERNRSSLVRVPLGWMGAGNMAAAANPTDPEAQVAAENVQTVEFRSPDGSANAHLLMAGMTVAARHGLEMAEALQLADRLHVNGNIFAPENAGIRQKLPVLPMSCADSGTALLAQREVYEEYGVFSPAVIDGEVARARSFAAEEADARDGAPGEINRIKENQLINRYLHSA